MKKKKNKKKKQKKKKKKMREEACHVIVPQSSIGSPRERGLLSGGMNKIKKGG